MQDALTRFTGTCCLAVHGRTFVKSIHTLLSSERDLLIRSSDKVAAFRMCLKFFCDAKLETERTADCLTLTGILCHYSVVSSSAFVQILYTASSDSCCIQSFAVKYEMQHGFRIYSVVF